jgi:predicted nucleic acid-binding protein
MKYLVDSNVLSEPTKPNPNRLVLEWLRENEREIVVNPVVLGEMEYGILILPNGARRRRLEGWLARGCERLQVVDFDQASGAAWARLLARLKSDGLSMPLKDSLIAASALAHHLIVATRNTADFRHAKVRLENPFEDSNR